MDYLSEYQRITQDLGEAAKFPGLDETLPEEYEEIRFFDDPPFEEDQAEAYITKYYSPLEEKYVKYFDIFQHPQHGKTASRAYGFVFSRLLAPAGFLKQFYGFTSKYDLMNYQSLFLHLVAEIQSFRNDYFDLFENGIRNDKERIRNILHDLEALSQLKDYLSGNGIKFDGDFIVTRTDFEEIFHDKSLRMRYSFNDKKFNLISPYILSYLIDQKVFDLLRLKLLYQEFNDNFPFQVNFHRFFQQKLTIALFNFLSKEEGLNFKLVKQNEKLECIYDYFSLIEYGFIDNDLNITTEKKKALAILKKWVITKS